MFKKYPPHVDLPVSLTSIMEQDPLGFNYKDIFVFSLFERTKIYFQDIFWFKWNENINPNSSIISFEIFI